MTDPRTVAIEIRRAGGWETVTFEDVTELRVADGIDGDALTLTLNELAV